MKLLFSIPSGYHLRELVLPLRRHLEANSGMTEVHLITPAAPIAKDIFTEFGAKFFYHENPKDDAGHRELFAQIKPDRVITNTVGHDALDEPIIRIGKELGIATITFIASWDNVWKIDRLIASGIKIAVADRFIVWNEMMKKHLMRTFSTIKADSIAVIGAPRLDYFTHTDKIATKEEVYAAFGFEDVSRPFIHLATTELYPMKYLAKALCDGLKANQIPNNPYLYASIHPGGEVEKYKTFEDYGFTVRRSPGRNDAISVPSFKYAPTEKDIYFLIGVFTHASVLVNHSSTVALESLITGVPVINVKYGIPFDWWNWYRCMVYRDFQQHYDDLVSDGATYVVKSKKELLSATADALVNPHAKDAARDITVKKMITTTDGTASQQVLNYILHI
ncbi:MAG: hypothetical protein A3C02_04550 [Candidatus Andersenbacteria bacterium RIFCSPHIGHO2_02_FULL_45_11]|uniref:Uncharacterized protein n=1 Tax=Candidatus Andersenbacteria bacterium RIFCSPHIGHO2_12_FULL_45_11 TaxID=1797281 RepID=A0A1G1X519_9BACT|nr:MAG: hypothetical protein A3C02_04550 [Candidatus Andersenbacteria bacterium RIFCSPHIGHO2_02_FULL_45_11]OGY35108.1 MAG: hypothetical protein A3D99_02410 [Candidatus Andersenbacteria bacterium RIFCSPHIGHO2_12_FULL_45_11]